MHDIEVGRQGSEGSRVIVGHQADNLDLQSYRPVAACPGYLKTAIDAMLNGIIHIQETNVTKYEKAVCKL